MEKNFIAGAGSAELTDIHNKQLQRAAIVFLKEARLRNKSIEFIVEEFAGSNQVQPKSEHSEIGFCMATGIAIARRRRQLAMSQKLLSELSGIQRSYISDLESGRRNLSLRNLVALANALGQRASLLLESIEEISFG